MLFRQRKPSEVLIRLTQGKARNFELDDLISRRKYGSRTEEFVRPLMRISDKYRTPEYPIGISNPASFDEIRELAEQLRSIGL